MKRVGITGVIGSGKSTFCRLLSAYSGAAVYDSDRRAKELMVESKQVLEGVTALFGQQAYRGAKLDREFVARQIFADQKLRHRLEEVVHPAVIADFERWCDHQSSDYVIIESALLLECDIQNHIDVKIVVDAPKPLCVERAMRRDERSRAEIEARMAGQMSAEQMRLLADYVVENGEEALLFEEAAKADEFIKSMPECHR